MTRQRNNAESNVFIEPKDQRELARFGLAGNGRMKSNNVCFFMDILSIVYCPLLALFVVLCWHCAPAPGMTPCGHYVVAKVIKNRDRRQTKSRFSSHHGSKNTVCRFFQSHSVSMGAPLQPLPSSLCPRLKAPCACCLRPCRPRLLRPLSVGMHAFRLFFAYPFDRMSSSPSWGYA